MIALIGKQFHDGIPSHKSLGIMPRDEISNNRRLAGIFKRMAQCYNYLGPEQRFRAIAYDRAARTLENLQVDVSSFATDIASLDRLPNIGEGIAERILEYIHTAHISTWDALQQKVPLALLEIMDVQGMGPATARRLHEELGICDKEGLEEAIRSDSIAKLKGFGPRRIDNIRKALKIDKASKGRFRLDIALEAGQSLLRKVRSIPGIIQAELAGSIRRRKETVGDIDVIAACKPSKRKAVVHAFTRFMGIEKILSRGDTKASILLSEPTVQADLRIVEPDAFGSALLYLTGSKEHNIQLRTLARERHLKINEYGLFSEDGKIRLAGETEASVYQALGLEYIEPELREDKGELLLAAQKKLPVLVASDEIRGDMQMHSIWSDGSSDIDTLAHEALQRFPQYEYIVITDHSPSSRIVHGLDAKRFSEQWIEIDKVNASIGRPFVRKGVEVDILPDGNLDLPDDILEGFEWVTASIHSGFTKDNTKRLIQACRNPLVHCIGHPSGRLLMKREAYNVNWPVLFQTAASTGTTLEINSQPDRLDLSDDLARQAIAAGVRLTISTDAHQPIQLDYLPLGVSQARRAGCTSQHILNTQPWEEVCRFRHAKASLALA